MAGAVGFGTDAVAAAGGGAPAAEARARVVEEDGDAAWIFAAAETRTLAGISEKRDGILRDGGERRGKRGAMPAAVFCGPVEMPHKGGPGSQFVELAHIARGRNCAIENGICDSPNRATQGARAREVFEGYPKIREMQRAEGEPSAELGGAGEAFEAGSVAHVSGLSEVEG